MLPFEVPDLEYIDNPRQYLENVSTALGFYALCYYLGGVLAGADLVDSASRVVRCISVTVQESRARDSGD